MLAPFVHLDVPLAGAAVGDRFALGDDDAHHLRTVLRLRPGAEVVLSDGRGAASDGRLTDGGVEVVSAPTVTPRPQPRLEVVHGLPKGRKLDEVVRVLTELGVDRVTPVHADRSPVELRGAKVDKAAGRWRAVARSAAGQSRRAWLPTIDPPGELDDALVELEDGIALLADPGADRGLGEVVRGRSGWPDRVVVGVGPESGWSEREVTTWRDAGATAVHLGATVLRTEHAAAAICAALSLALGRMD